MGQNLVQQGQKFTSIDDITTQSLNKGPVIDIESHHQYVWKKTGLHLAVRHVQEASLMGQNLVQQGQKFTSIDDDCNLVPNKRPVIDIVPHHQYKTGTATGSQGLNFKMSRVVVKGSFEAL